MLTPEQAHEICALITRLSDVGVRLKLMRRVIEITGIRGMAPSVVDELRSIQKEEHDIVGRLESFVSSLSPEDQADCGDLLPLGRETLESIDALINYVETPRHDTENEVS